MGSLAGISVVIPAHNRADLVPRAIDSVLRQEKVRPQIVVVDDGSTDDTPGVLASYGDRITTVRNERPMERAVARNMGAAAAQGSILCFLDSDDEWKPTKLIRQVGFVKPGVACACAVDQISLAGALIRKGSPPGPATLDAVIRRNTFTPSSLAIAAEDFRALGGFPDSWSLQGSEDWLFFVRLLGSGRRIHVLPDALVRYRVHSESWTANPDRVALSMWTAVECMEAEGYLLGDAARDVRGRAATYIARRFAAAGDTRAAIAWVLRARRRAGWRKGALALWLAAMSGGRGSLRRRRPPLLGDTG